MATGILFLPAAPLFLFMHGKDITIEKGMETTAFVDGDTHLQLAALTRVVAQTASAVQQVAVDSDVANCNILVDGTFAGDNPFDSLARAGQALHRVAPQGFADWTRDLQSSGGAITLHAEMQAATTASK